ncbi:hypothetical protein H7D62_016450, partial [Brucella melitensis]|nr:hypothetical protein [Brucella melitensis]
MGDSEKGACRLVDAGIRRLRRVAGTLYTADEIHEIFRRFSIQRPEPKGELEHVNAFTLLVA